MLVSTISKDAFKRRAAPNVNLKSTFLVIFDPGDWASRCYLLSGKGAELDERVPMAIGYVDWLFGRLTSRTVQEIGVYTDYRPRQILFQQADCPVNTPSVSWEARTDWDDITLIPDLYYHELRGNEDFMPAGSPDCPAWDDRRSVVLWRGVSTGSAYSLFPETLPGLLRYKLCLAARPLGASADIGFTSIVQYGSDEAHDSIVRHLTEIGAMKSFMLFEQMAAYKYIVDVDGNANSWNFMRKLRLGCCVLKLDSPWRQWFSQDLVAWEHYVPVAHDASDLVEKVEWCLAHDDEARQIATRGRAFALAMSFNAEMRKAALRLISASGPLVLDR